MNHRCTIFAGAVCLLLIPFAAAFPQYTVNIIATEGATPIDTIVIGVNVVATYGIDGDLQEYELPPLPPSGVADARSVNLPGRSDIGQGVRKDLRPLEYSTQTDSFRIRFQLSTENTSDSMTFAWSDGLESVGGGRWRIVAGEGSNIDMTDTFSASMSYSETGGIFYIITSDAAQFLTFSMDSLALDANYKGKRATYEKPVKKALKVPPYFPMPNTVNGLFQYLAKGSGNSITVGSLATGADGYVHGVYYAEKKYKDILGSLVQKKPADPTLHTGTSVCLDSNYMKPPKIKAFKVKPGKYLKYHKPGKDGNNKLFGQTLTLKVNLAFSQSGITNPGLGDLIIGGGVYDGKTVDSLVSIADQALACATSLTASEMDGLADIIEEVNKAFSVTDPLPDSVSFYTGDTKIFATKFNAGVYVSDAAISTITLRRDAALQPKIIPLPPVNLSEEPVDYAVHQNYPNPFNPTTTLSFTLADEALVSLSVYDMLGREVARLSDREEFSAGENEVEFDAGLLPSGVYFYRVTMFDVHEGTMLSQQGRKMLLLR